MLPAAITIKNKYAFGRDKYGKQQIVHEMMCEMNVDEIDWSRKCVCLAVLCSFPVLAISVVSLIGFNVILII